MCLTFGDNVHAEQLSLQTASTPGVQLVQVIQKPRIAAHAVLHTHKMVEDHELKACHRICSCNAVSGAGIQVAERTLARSSLKYAGQGSSSTSGVSFMSTKTSSKLG